DHRLVIGHLDTGVLAERVAGLLRGPADPACEECAERWRCGASCACANLAETGTTHVPGGVQCWYEQASARGAAGVGTVLLEEKCEAFLAWTYGRVAQAAEQMALAQAHAAQTMQQTQPMHSVRRVRRLPVLQGVA